MFLLILLPLSFLLASELKTQDNSDQNTSIQVKDSNQSWIEGIPKKTTTFFGGIVDDIKAFGEDNHIIDEKK
jgi:hypothetical protein